MKRKKFLLITIFLSFFLISRIFLLYYTNVGTDFAFLEQGGRTGAIGLQWSKGNHQMYIETAHKIEADHQLGLPLMGIVAGVFFDLIGVSWQSVMFPVIIQGALLLILLFVFLEKYFSLETASIGSVIYLFTFPTWIMTTTSQPATVLLGILSSFFVIYMLLKCLTVKYDKFTIIVTGLSVGVSLFLDFYWSLLTFVGIFVYFLVYLLRKRMKIRVNYKKVFVLSLVIFISLVPFIFYHYYLHKDADTIGFSGETIKKHESKGLELFEGDYIMKGGVFLYSFFHSFGFSKSGQPGITLLMNLFFFILVVFSYVNIFYLSLKNFWNGKFNSQSTIYVLLLILIILNMGIFFFTGLWREMTNFNNIFLQRQFEYFSYLHFLSIISLSIFYYRIKKISKMLKFPLISLLVIFMITSFMIFANNVGRYIYNPVKGAYYPLLSYSETPELYRSDPSLFGYNSLTKNSTKEYENPPFPRSMEQINNICKKFRDPEKCYRLVGVYFGHIRRFDISEGMNLCKKMENVSECKKGVSWATGYYIAYDSDKAKKYIDLPCIDERSFEEGLETYNSLNKKDIRTNSLKDLGSSLEIFEDLFQKQISNNRFSYF